MTSEKPEETAYKVKLKAKRSLRSLIDSTKAKAKKSRRNGRFAVARALELQAKDIEEELKKW